ncbi:MAG: hypothetical protein EZS28_003591 [Streblomastix strix]|uniref:Uncharacterized protein n=1 Tax=Streblomastix strix TaxID=222440 RepID=A0A5J4X106_9EUKA|nr:MAG: hypothetical protein EZS28_003591 [Streblomastix strix]
MHKFGASKISRKKQAERVRLKTSQSPLVTFRQIILSESFCLFSFCVFIQFDSVVDVFVISKFLFIN